MKLNKNKITLKQELENDNIKIQTEQKSRDDNQKATIKYTYNISNNFFIITKEVQFKNTVKWIKRSEFNYVRQKI